MESQQRIVSMLRAEYERAAEKYRNAHAERVGIDAAANAWDEFNPDDGVGGMSQNPHNTLKASEREEAAKIYAAQMKDAYDLAVDTFIDRQTSNGCDTTGCSRPCDILAKFKSHLMQVMEVDKRNAKFGIKFEGIYERSNQLFEYLDRL